MQIDFDHDRFVQEAKLPTFWVGDDRAYVYVMHSTRYTKVGLAANPQARLAELQQNNPAKVLLDRAFKFDDRRYAVLAERTALDLLAPWRVRGEWFLAKPRDVIGVVLQVVRATNELYGRNQVNA